MDIKTPREYFLDEAIKRHWNVLYGSKIGLDFCKEYADYYHQAKLKELNTTEERGEELVCDVCKGVGVRCIEDKTDECWFCNGTGEAN